ALSARCALPQRARPEFQLCSGESDICPEEVVVPRPLEGIRVIELANFIAGPFAAMLLADMGADVIKIELPGRGDLSRASFPQVNGESAGYMAINRNKRGIALDLKRPEAVEI